MKMKHFGEGVIQNLENLYVNRHIYPQFLNSGWRRAAP